jgi:hypothetical protein
MKSLNIISGMAILLAAMATPLLSGCAADVDSDDATADEAVASNDSATSPDAENLGTKSDALFGGYGCGAWWGGVGAGGLGLGVGLGGLGCGGTGVIGYGVGIGILGFGLGLGGLGCGLC